MHNYGLYKDGELINIIYADEAFVSGYAADNGYTYEIIPATEPEPEPESKPDVWAQMAAALKEGVDSIG